MFLYLLIAPLLYILSFLPTGFLYKLSDVLAFILRDVIKYRKQLVIRNIQSAFPEKNAEEQKAILKNSYIHLSDRVVEALKCISISKEEIHKRVNVINLELMDKWYHENKNVVVLLGHIGSWEFAACKASLVLKHKTYGVVSLLKNKYFNRLIQKSRAKFGMHIVGMQHVSSLLRNKEKRATTVLFIGDQSPHPKKAFWTNFLNQDTPFFRGAERYASTQNCAVIYIEIRQLSRGNYEIELFNICENASEQQHDFITSTFSTLLEKTIVRNPSDWLWTHNRWKHKRE